jgi:hypothetical protein
MRTVGKSPTGFVSRRHTPARLESSSAPSTRSPTSFHPGTASRLGFPGSSELAGPGTARSRKLAEAWAGFPLGAELEARLGKPTRLANDSDMHGLAVIRGEGLELVLTLGTGLGTAVFLDGSPTPHLELALMPFRGRGTFQDRLGNRTRRRIGNRRWSKRVLAAVEMFDALLHVDRLYVGGGNAKKLTVDLGHRVELVDNAAGILGGIKLWELDEPLGVVDSKRKGLSPHRRRGGRQG